MPSEAEAATLVGEKAQVQGGGLGYSEESSRELRDWSPPCFGFDGWAKECRKGTEPTREPMSARSWSNVLEQESESALLGLILFNGLVVRDPV